MLVPTLSFASTSTFVAAAVVAAWFISLVFCSNVFAALTFWLKMCFELSLTCCNPDFYAQLSIWYEHPYNPHSSEYGHILTHNKL